jgi:hypothetical protein
MSTIKITPSPQPLEHTQKNNKSKPDHASAGATVIKESGSPAAVFTPSKGEVVKGYEKEGHVYNKSQIEAMKAEAERTYSSLIETVRRMIQKQGHKVEDVLAKLDAGQEFMIEIDAETRAEAQAAIADDGYWGVAKTSERIIDFAKAVSGDNPEKFDKLVDAIKAGFEAAKKAFGGELPDISQKTYDAVMLGLKEWAGR